MIEWEGRINLDLNEKMISAREKTIFPTIGNLHPGWPDEFVKESPKMLPNTFSVKINT
jgi:hypothetical protein